MPTPNIVVLGTGMAGFGAAHRLHSEGITPVMYDKNAYYGGYTAAFRYERGFLFDVGPPISFSQEPRHHEVFFNILDEKVQKNQIKLKKHSRSYQAVPRGATVKPR